MDVDDGDVEMDWLSVKEEACSPGTQTEKSLAMYDVGMQTGNYSAPVSTMTKTDMVKTSAEIRIRIMRISGYPDYSNLTDPTLQIRISGKCGYPDNTDTRVIRIPG